MHLNIKNCIMGTNLESSSPQHHSGVTFMISIFGFIVTCYIYCSSVSVSIYVYLAVTIYFST